MARSSGKSSKSYLGASMWLRYHMVQLPLSPGGKNMATAETKLLARWKKCFTSKILGSQSQGPPNREAFPTLLDRQSHATTMGQHFLS